MGWSERGCCLWTERLTPCPASQSFITYLMIDFQMNFGLYIGITYALSMASTALAVMLGSSVEDPKLASEMLPLLFVPQMMFAGFFVAINLIPTWLRWAQYLCALTYATRLMAIAEFDGCEGAGSENCESIISDTLQADPDEIWWYWLVLIALWLVFRMLGLGILTKKASKFL